jgi:hypothetical protein
MTGMQRIHRFQELAAGRTGWLGKLGLFTAAVLGIALVGALAVLSLVVVVVLIPVVAVALVIFRWRLGRAVRQAANAASARGGAAPGRPQVIETDYVVIDRESR